MLLVNSCNDALMQMSYRIGPVTFSQFQSLFGSGQRTWIDLPGETSTASLIYDEKALESTINLATNSFGQNFNVTMVQMASAFCSLVNGASCISPTWWSELPTTRAIRFRRLSRCCASRRCSKEVSDQMKQYLRAVVTDGSASAAGVDGYDVGGKTGTAQKFDTETGQRAKGKYLVSFIGYAPQEHPEVLVYVIVDEPNVEDQAHSSYALGIAHNILQQILPYMNISRITEENPQ